MSAEIRSAAPEAIDSATDRTFGTPAANCARGSVIHPLVRSAPELGIVIVEAITCRGVPAMFPFQRPVVAYTGAPT